MKCYPTFFFFLLQCLNQIQLNMYLSDKLKCLQSPLEILRLEEAELSVLHPPHLRQVEVVMATAVCSCTCCHGWEGLNDDVYSAARYACLKTRMSLPWEYLPCMEYRDISRAGLHIFPSVLHVWSWGTSIKGEPSEKCREVGDSFSRCGSFDGVCMWS